MGYMSLVGGFNGNPAGGNTIVCHCIFGPDI